MNPEEPTCGTCGFPTRINEHSGECKKRKESEKRIMGDIGRAIARIWETCKTQGERVKTIDGLLDESLESELTQSLLSDDDVSQMRDALASSLSDEGPEEFAQSVMDAVRPLIDVRIDHAKEFEDAQALEIMGDQEFTFVNERISYTVGNGDLQLHLAPAFEVKDHIEDLYKDALEKLVDFIKAHPEIKRVGGRSWLNATKTYSAMKERLGFEISDYVDDEEETPRQPESESSQTRPAKNAYMSREKYLETYG
jgi:hypothetical protein